MNQSPTSILSRPRSSHDYFSIEKQSPEVPLVTEQNQLPEGWQRQGRLLSKTHLALFLLSPILGWVYVLVLLYRQLRYGILLTPQTLYLSKTHLQGDRPHTVMTLILFFVVSPSAVFLLIVYYVDPFSNDPNASFINYDASNDLIIFHQYAPIATMLVVYVWLGVMIWRYSLSTEKNIILGDAAKRLEKYQIHTIKMYDGQGVITKRYDTAADLYEYLYVRFSQKSLYVTLALATVLTAVKVTAVKWLDFVPSASLWWVSLVYWIGIFLIFDMICVMVIVRYDNLRRSLVHFNSLTSKSIKGNRFIPYLNISERLMAHEKESLEHAAVTLTAFRLDSFADQASVLKGAFSPPRESPSDNFESWFRIREELVFEIAHPGTLMHSTFQPTNAVIYLSLFISLVYVIFRVFLIQSPVGPVAFSQILVLGTTALYAVAMFTITSRIQRLFKHQAEAIAGLELEISKCVFDLERCLQKDPTATSSKLNELRSFYRLIQAANQYLQAVPAQPKVLGFGTSQWIWVGLFTLGISLNALFVIASINGNQDQPTAVYHLPNNTTGLGNGTNHTGSLPGFCDW